MTIVLPAYVYRKPESNVPINLPPASQCKWVFYWHGKKSLDQILWFLLMSWLQSTAECTHSTSNVDRTYLHLLSNKPCRMLRKSHIWKNCWKVAVTLNINHESHEGQRVRQNRAIFRGFWLSTASAISRAFCYYCDLQGELVLTLLMLPLCCPRRISQWGNCNEIISHSSEAPQR